MADWDDDDFEPEGFVAKTTDKWEGEDEDDENIKDNWDDDEDEEQEKKEQPTTESTEPKAYQVKKKKTVKEKILEKEKQQQEEKKKIVEMNLAEKKEEKTLTPEEELAEKLRRQKLVEEADLELALETFGSGKDDNLPEKTIDGCHPTSREEFAELSSLLVAKLSQYETNAEYVAFLDGLFRDLCASLDAEDIKKLGSTLNVLSSEKLKQQKGTKAKKKGKKAGATIKAGKTKDDFGMNDAYGDAYQDDFDGFL